MAEIWPKVEKQAGPGWGQLSYPIKIQLEMAEI